MKKFIFVCFIIVMLSGASSVIFHIILPFNEPIEFPSTYAILFPEGHNIIGLEGTKAADGIIKYRNDKVLFYPYAPNYYRIRGARNISLGLFSISSLSLLICWGFHSYQKKV